VCFVNKARRHPLSIILVSCLVFSFVFLSVKVAVVPYIGYVSSCLVFARLVLWLWLVVRVVVGLGRGQCFVWPWSLALVFGLVFVLVLPSVMVFGCSLLLAWGHGHWMSWSPSSFVCIPGFGCGLGFVLLTISMFVLGVKIS
jgi:hypothetical protein